MSRDYDSLVEQARQFPNSTAAIGLQAIRTAEYERSRERRAAFKSFFKGVFSKKA